MPQRARRRVLLHPDFKDDFHRQRAWLAEQGRPGWIDALVDGIKEVMVRLAKLPASGAVIQRSEEIVVRKIFLRRLPYVAWYGHRHTDPIGDITLLRLFGRGQRRRNPRDSTL